MPASRPPRLAHGLLRACLGPAHDALIGDLVEEYHDHACHYGRLRAALIFWRQALAIVPTVWFYSLFWNSAMLKNYLVTTLRNVRKYRGFSFINISGLAVSMAVCLLVLLFVRDQYGYERFHPHAERVYRVVSTVEEPYRTFRMATSPGPLGEVLRQDHAQQVEAVVRMTRFGGRAVQGALTLPFSGLYAEPTFFDVFGFPLVQGDPATALTAPYSVVLTEAAAQKLFGEADPMGQVLTRENVGDFTVTGVVRLAGYETNFEFEGLLSFATLVQRQAQGRNLALDDWGITSEYYTYFRLAPDADADVLAAALPGLIARMFPAEAERPRPALTLQPLTRIAMGSTGYGNEIGDPASIIEVTVFTILGLLVLLAAAFNYVTLSTARAAQRAKEIGVRKVVGAYRGQLVKQFLGEAVVMALLALVLAAGLLAWLVPAFNELGLMQEIGARLTFDPVADWPVYLLFVGFALVVGVLAGLYPALRLAAFAPVRALRGASGGAALRGVGLRKTLVVGQFVLSMVLIVLTLVIYRQSSYLLHADYGLDEAHLVTIDLQGLPAETFRQELERHPGFAQVVLASDVPIVGGNWSKQIQSTSMADPDLISYYATDAGFLDAFGLDLLAGRGFVPGSAAQDGVLITKAALPLLGFDTPADAVGQSVRLDETPAPILGVVSDLMAQGYERGYVPVAFAYAPDHFRRALAHLRPGQRDDALAHLDATWQAMTHGLPLSYRFFDEEKVEEYAFVQDVIGILGVVAGIAVLVACLGLLGLASFTAQTRVREVGIRKVLGAEVRSLLLLLSREYLILLGIAVLVAVPLAYLGASAFLSQFANHIDLGVGLFGLAFGALLALACLALASPTLRAAYANPVDTLRHE